MNKLTRKYDLKKGLDFIGITCVFYCHDGKGNLLLSKRSQNCRDEQGVWDCGSGSMEFGEESLISAAKREILEEYCVVPKKVKFHFATNVIRMQGKRKSHWIAFIYSALVDPKKCKIGEPKDIDEIAWFPINKLPKPQHSMLQKHLKIVLAKGGF